MLVRILDTETTGLGDDAEIAEIGFCDIKLFPEGHNDIGIKIGPTGSCLVRISKPMPPEAQAVHHISDADLRLYGLDFPDAWGAMLADPYCDGTAAPHDQADIYAAHNAEFDRRFIGPDWTGKAPWICTMKCAIRAWPELPAFGNQVIRYAKGIDLADKGKAEPPHSAAADAYVTAHILAAMLRLYSLQDLMRWTEEPTMWPRILFGKYKGQEWSEIPNGYLEWMLNKPAESEDDGWDSWQACAKAELLRRRTNRVTSRAR